MRKLFWLVSVFLFAILFGGCVHQSVVDKRKERESKVMAERVELVTSDGVRIVGDFYPARIESLKDEAFEAKGVVLLHMMPAERGSWRQLAEKLVENGLAALAIDLRGHGESTETLEGKRLDYRQFTDKQHQKSIEDVRTAVSWLMKEREVAKEQILLVGASIGANLALQYLQENPQVGKAVLISPGLDYRGIKTEPLIGSLTPTQKIFIVVGRGDADAYQSSEKLNALASVEKRLKVVDSEAHGTDLFEAEPSLMEEVAFWLGG